MGSQAQVVEKFILKQPENKILTANKIYGQLPEHFLNKLFIRLLPGSRKRGFYVI